LQRELGGRAHVFAHNGNMPGIKDKFSLGSHRFMPGEPISESEVIALMQGLVWARMPATTAA
jgi:hypothetical protein